MVGPSKHLKFNAPRASSFTSFGFFVAISVLMMVVDHQMQVMEPVRSGFAWVSDWIHNGVSSPARGVDFADSYLRSKSSLIAQNEELKKRLAESEMQRYRMSTLSDNFKKNLWMFLPSISRLWKRRKRLERSLAGLPCTSDYESLKRPSDDRG